MWIHRITLPDIVTFGALCFSLLALYLATHEMLLLSLASIMMAMLWDAYDGYLARRSGISSGIGRELDSLVDVITYLICPVAILFVSGFTHPVHLFSYVLLILGGIFRLAVFTAKGFDDESESRLYYRGLPVFWIPYVVVGVIVLESIVTYYWLHLALPLLLLGISFLMLYDKPRFKPKSIHRITIVQLGVISLLLLHKYIDL